MCAKGVCVVAMFALLSGCPVNLDTADYPTVRPKDADVAGTYKPTPAAAKYIQQVGKYPAADISIVLAADGKATIMNIPDWWMDGFGQPHGKFDTGQGKWRLEKPQSYWELELNWRSTSASGAHSGAETSLDLVGKQPPYLIRMWLGDPDSGHTMEFVREDRTN
jgi:hypothetical protein